MEQRTGNLNGILVTLLAAVLITLAGPTFGSIKSTLPAPASRISAPVGAAASCGDKSKRYTSQQLKRNA